MNLNCHIRSYTERIYLPLLRLDFKLYMLIKLIVRAGPDDPEPSLSSGALESGCWSTSHHVLSISLHYRFFF